MGVGGDGDGGMRGERGLTIIDDDVGLLEEETNALGRGPRWLQCGSGPVVRAIGGGGCCSESCC